MISVWSVPVRLFVPPDAENTVAPSSESVTVPAPDMSIRSTFDS